MNNLYFQDYISNINPTRKEKIYFDEYKLRHSLKNNDNNFDIFLNYIKSINKSGWSDLFQSVFASGILTQMQSTKFDVFKNVKF